jgi:tryptophan synthase alpha chain
MPYLMGGFPDLDGSLAVARAYVEFGADLIELGVPFSDPLADGPVIHAAGTRALAGGATLNAVLGVCRQISGAVPVTVMCYANMALRSGPEQFATRLEAAGAAGAIIPDLPPEEAGPLRDALAAAGIAHVPLVAPTTPPDRRRKICEAATGFVYLVSTTGVTGERDELPQGLVELVEDTKREAQVPVAVGFGIGTPEQVHAVGRIADGVIVGTRLVREVSEADGLDRALRGLKDFLTAARAGPVPT